MLIEWAIFRCCMWLVNVHARNFRGSWEWLKLALPVASIAGFLFALAFLGRLALNSEWETLAYAIVITIAAMPVMTFFASKLGETMLFFSPIAIIIGTYLAISMW
ncbi:MAG TPA: hypothetical protein DCQ42_14915 [Halomonas sp.]|nr:hypothetical protein [Halomonas sp.]HAO02965.1 hypothetical protein [Halomonas sp.]